MVKARVDEGRPLCHFVPQISVWQTLKQLKIKDLSEQFATCHTLVRGQLNSSTSPPHPYRLLA
jgi:hypothetical protein